MRGDLVYTRGGAGTFAHVVSPYANAAVDPLTIAARERPYAFPEDGPFGGVKYAGLRVLDGFGELDEMDTSLATVEPTTGDPSTLTTTTWEEVAKTLASDRLTVPVVSKTDAFQPQPEQSASLSSVFVLGGIALILFFMFR